MPIYEYQCLSCGHHLEKLQRMSDAPLVDCPTCQEPQLRKKVSAAGFRLKGSGWYETDFKTKGKKNLHADSHADAKQDKSKEKSKDSAKETPKSESKPKKAASGD